MSLRNFYILDFHNPVNVSGCLLRVHCYSKIQEKNLLFKPRVSQCDLVY